MAAPRNNSYAAPSGGGIYAGRPAELLSLGNQRVAIWGQSNALGRADRTDIALPPLSADPGLAAFDAGSFARVRVWDGSAYVPLQMSNNGAAAGQFGSEFGIAVRWMRETASGTLYVEKAASSGISITVFDPAASLYSSSRTEHNQATAWLASNGVSVAGRSWLWIQGESDAAQTQAWYETRLNALIAARISDGIQDAGSRVLLAQMAVGTAAYGAGVAAAKTAIAAANPSTTSVFSMPFYMKADNLHQNGRGQVQAGYDAFELLFGAPHIAT